MISCKDTCPVDGQKTCCVKCDEPCENKCIDTPDKCERSSYDNEGLEVFQNESQIILRELTKLFSIKSELEAKEKKMRAQLQEAMEKYNIKSFESDQMKLTYIEKSTRASIDSALLKKLYPTIADECTKTSETKASIRITLRGGE